jgi:hypothetical protein
MRVLGSGSIISAMNRPATSSRVLVVADRRPASAESGAAPLRRYRIARLRFDGRTTDSAARYEHLKRVYD